MTPVSGLETAKASSLKEPQTPLVSEATWRVTDRDAVSRPAPASLPSPRTNGIESALNTGPPVTVTEWPVGAVESSVTFSVVCWCSAASRRRPPRRRRRSSPTAAFVQLKALETYGPPAGVLTVSSACVQPAWPTAGYVAEPGPEPPSATALESVNEPAAAGR